METEDVLRAYLLYLVLPLWIGVGAADWLCHRIARIEYTSGVKESVIHAVMLAEAGLPVLLGLFFEINALIIAIMVIALFLHEITSYWDVSYAEQHRKVAPIEQRIHDYLGAVPFMATSFVLVLYWPQALALVGLGAETPRFSLAYKSAPLSGAYIATILCAIAIFILLPYAAELWRGFRAMRNPADTGRTGPEVRSAPRPGVRRALSPSEAPPSSGAVRPEFRRE